MERRTRTARLVTAIVIVFVCVLGLGGQTAAASAPGSHIGGLRIGDGATDHSAIALVTQWSRAHATGEFGGAWLSPTDGSVYAAFTGNTAAYANQLSAVLPRGAVLHVVKVARSWNSLVYLQSQIDRDALWLQKMGVTVTSTGIAPDKNTVVVSLRRVSSGAIQLLRSRYGNLVISQRDYLHFLDRYNVGPPWVGGMALTGSCQSSDCVLADCTANFTVYWFYNNVQFYDLLTAGHCFGYLSQVTNGSGVPIGAVVQQFWASGVNADVEVIQESAGTQSPFIITHDPTRKGVVGSEATQNMGEAVCKSGITTDETCGWTISAVHATVNICADPPTCSQTVTTYDQVEATNPSANSVLPGDSGGPVYHYDSSGNLWGTGIESAGDSTGTVMVYSFLANALGDVQSYLCTTGVC